MLVNQAYYRIEGKATWANRLFIFALEILSVFTMGVQFYLMYLLWTQGLEFETKTATA